MIVPGSVDLLVAATVSEGGVMDQVMEWANVEEPWELWLFGFGLIAQLTFFGRWIVQWIASERRRQTHMPQLFWWLSLAGATMLLVYFTLRREPIGMLGQSVGWLIYGRNLYFVKVKHKQVMSDE